MIITPPRPIRVCFVNMHAYYIFAQKPLPIGGAEVKIFELATHLNNTYETSIITGDFGQPPVEQYGNVRLFSSADMNWPSNILNALKLWIAQYRTSSDIYVTTVSGKDVFAVWLFCKVFRKKFIYFTASDNECNGKNIKARPFWGALFKIALEHADVIVTSVRNHANLLRTHHPNITCPIIHIGYGLTTPKQELIQKEYILWLARCDSWKNPFLFIELAKTFPTEKFVMIAASVRDQEDLFSRVKTEASKLKNMKFIPGIQHADGQQFFNKAKISVNTSDFEGFSVAFIQSGFAATPIATLNLNPDSVITTYNLGSCARGNFNLMKKQVRELLYNEEIWKQKSKNISSYMRKNHNINNVVHKWEKLFAQLKSV